jgi:uncharacterized protein (TIGR03067 family)
MAACGKFPFPTLDHQETIEMTFGPQQSILTMIFLLLDVATTNPIYSSEEPQARSGEHLQPAETVKGAESKDRDRFQGTWNCIRIEMNGEVAPIKYDDPSENPYWRIMFDGDLFKFIEDDGKASKPAYKVSWSCAASPSQLDLAGITKEENLAGIYRFEDTKLFICLTVDKDSPIRPTRFKTKEGLPIMLLVLSKK